MQLFEILMGFSKMSMLISQFGDFNNCFKNLR